MYHLLKGLHEYLTRKDEFTVLIIGLDGAGKTTLLEKIKTLYNETPGLNPDKIAPTVGQNTGKITLPSTILQFWDLGGQRGIRNIWHRYYDDCHAVVYVIDADDRERLAEGWEVFGTHFDLTKTPYYLHLKSLESHYSYSRTNKIRHTVSLWKKYATTTKTGISGRYKACDAALFINTMAVVVSRILAYEESELPAWT
ncbi:hypothetical protein ONZ45_g9681 [Pleurotus djamor]|nr:hypothetical protein ONZ45_g9681 [Pleurotus djamor]